MKRRSSPAYAFPPIEQADENGLLAYGGDLSPERLISAYESGVFPWYEEGQPILWWSPPQRMLLFPERFKVRKSFKQVLRNKGFDWTVDQAFEEVIEQCATVDRKDQESTWITEAMNRAYVRLHTLGFAHSFETWYKGKLVGGLYGICLGRVFFGESMFSTESDASKFAFYWLSQFALNSNIEFIDCQLYTDHLASLGAEEITRSEYMQLLQDALTHPDQIGHWNKHTNA
jgi:leucyl/phenylalanyl-tRNA--protein transferase